MDPDGNSDAQPNFHGNPDGNLHAQPDFDVDTNGYVFEHVHENSDCDPHA
jgi:Cu/Zn superoxide dismutase